MTTNLDDLGILELEEIKNKASVLIEKKQRENIDNAYAQLLAVAANVGMSLDELIEYGQKNSGKSPEKRTVAPRYIHPTDKNKTWTGRGKQPRWVVDALADGKTLEDLLIK